MSCLTELAFPDLQEEFMVASSDLEMPLLAVENGLGILDSWFSVTHAVCVLIHGLLEPLASLPSVYWEAMQHLHICVFLR